tara:strand:- start:153 stop:521 length:369 start_codon:yes stop_codon:yes gene_type:complete
MSSQLNVDTIADKAGSGPVGLTKQIAAKAFGNAGSDASIRNSLNISTNTDSGTGLYTYGLSNAFTADIDQHCAMAGMCTGGARYPRTGTTNTTASAIEIHIENSSGSNTDSSHTFQLTGDLA